MNGKGDSPRPVNYDRYAANWDTIRWGPRPTSQLGHASWHPPITQTKLVKAKTVKKGRK